MNWSAAVWHWPALERAEFLEKLFRVSVVSVYQPAEETVRREQRVVFALRPLIGLARVVDFPFRPQREVARPAVRGAYLGPVVYVPRAWKVVWPRCEPPAWRQPHLYSETLARICSGPKQDAS